MVQTVKLQLVVQSSPQQTITFVDCEVPEKIAFGGSQMTTVHKLVGGKRVIDAMGADDADLCFSGWFLGASAVDRVRFVDNVRRNGYQCTLTWDQFQYQVVLKEFTADYEKPYKIPYQIKFEVIQDQTQAITTVTTPSPTDALNTDSATATQLSSAVGNGALSSQVSAATSAVSTATGTAQPLANGLVSLTTAPATSQISQISTLAPGSSAAILSAQNSLASLQTGVRSAISGAEITVGATPTLGFINPSMPMAAQISTLIAQCNAAAQLPSLYELSAVTTRMQSNLVLVANPAGNKQVVTGGGNLYQLAAQQYGDATRWGDIAQASGISDPMTTGFNTITIPS